MRTIVSCYLYGRRHATRTCVARVPVEPCEGCVLHNVAGAWTLARIGGQHESDGSCQRPVIDSLRRGMYLFHHCRHGLWREQGLDLGPQDKSFCKHHAKRPDVDSVVVAATEHLRRHVNVGPCHGLRPGLRHGVRWRFHILPRRLVNCPGITLKTNKEILQD